jgi:hypothetical protein
MPPAPQFEPARAALKGDRLPRETAHDEAPSRDARPPPDFTPEKDDILDRLVVRVAPENVTQAPKIEARGSDALFEERDVTLKRGELFESLLKSNGATNDQIRSIVTALGGQARTSQLVEGQRVRILLAPGSRAGEGRQVARVILFGERGVEGVVAVNDRGNFIPVSPPAAAP